MELNAQMTLLIIYEGGLLMGFCLQCVFQTHIHQIRGSLGSLFKENKKSPCLEKISKHGLFNIKI